MKKWVCGVCGCVHEGTAPPEKCPSAEQAGRSFRNYRLTGWSGPMNTGSWLVPE